MLLTEVSMYVCLSLIMEKEGERMQNQDRKSVCVVVVITIDFPLHDQGL